MRSRPAPTGSHVRTSAPTARPTPGAGRRDLLAVVLHAMPSPRRAAEEPTCEGVELRAGAPLGAGGVPRRLGGGHRNEPTETGAAPDSAREKELALRFDRGRCAARRYHPEPAGNVRAARGRCLHLPGRCAPANQRASGQPGHRDHPADVEIHVRRRAYALRPRSESPRSGITLRAIPQPRSIMPAYSLPTPPCGRTSVPMTPTRLHAKRDYATTAQNARLRRSSPGRASGRLRLRDPSTEAEVCRALARQTEIVLRRI